MKVEFHRDAEHELINAVVRYETEVAHERLPPGYWAGRSLRQS